MLLLGASGLLGHNVLLRLLAEGHYVKALVRKPEAVGIKDDMLDVVEGQLTDDQALSAAAVGCEAIVNCAGVTDMSLLHCDDYNAINRDLCATLVNEIMPHSGIKTLVHVSTVNTIGYGTAESFADEAEPMRPPFAGSFYADSKRAGEQAVIEAAHRHAGDWHVVIVNPGFMLGPWDAKPSSGRMLLAAYRRPLMLAPKGGKAFVHVGDVAQAVVAALTKGTNGQRYIAVNSNACLSIRELYLLQAEVMGYRQFIIEVPNWMLALAGRVGDVLRAMGVRTEVSTRNVRQLMVREYYNNRRAVEELGMSSTPIAKAIEAFYDWRTNNTAKI